jgi:sortase A
VSPLGPAKKKLRGMRSSILRAASYFFFVIATVALGYAGYVFADAHIYQAVEESRFESADHTGGPIPVSMGAVIGEMEVPRLGLKAIVVQGDTPRVLRRAVGHLPETALPGELGNVALAGHRDGFFRPLRYILVGDAITLKTNHGDFQYQVESTAVVAPSDIQVLRASGGRTLTLVTCYPFFYVGSAPNRFVVTAREVGSIAKTSEP